jgi:pilus assembly protein CpaE
MYLLNVALVISTGELWEEAQAALRKLPVRVVLEQQEIGDPAVFLEKMIRLEPDVIFLDVNAAGGLLNELVRQLKDIRSFPDVIAINTSSEPQAILAVMRAGAREYLYPPLNPSLEQALSRIASEREQRREVVRPGGKCIGFVSAKGACGATTLACHVGVQLSRQTDRETLLIDLDVNTGIVRLLLKAKSRYSIVDALNNIQRLDSSYWKAIVSNGTARLEVVAGPAEASVPEALNATAVQQVLRFVRPQYGWTVVDLGHGASPALFAAVDELDELFLVTTLEVPALYQTRRVVEALNKRTGGRVATRLIVNRMPRRNELTSKEVESVTGLPVYASIPNDYQALNEAYSGGELLTGNSLVSRKIAGLTEKITGSPASEAQKKRMFSVFR